uniref:Secreted protein n=1 Tax=Vespula pensylvanica TaxID=30213 RepID=A0A834NQJ3_VESPE|nr:hypothetical protein H0235_012252 [Vespula pensylvanica]
MVVCSVLLITLQVRSGNEIEQPLQTYAGMRWFNPPTLKLTVAAAAAAAAAAVEEELFVEVGRKRERATAHGERKGKSAECAAGTRSAELEGDERYVSGEVERERECG